MSTLYHLGMDSGHWRFDAYGATATEAAAAFADGWARHCRQTGADPDYWGLTLDELAAAAVEVRLGGCYRDHAPI
jgi:hypothetical protein